MRRKFFLCLLLVGFGAFGFAQENESKNPFAQAFPPSMFLFGPDFNGNFMPFFSNSALSSLMNPASGALNASRTYEGNFMLLAGKDSSLLVPEDIGEQTDLFGFAVNGGVSIPTDVGVFNATAHFFYSHARSFAVRPTLGASFAYSRILPGTSVALGGGIKGFFAKNLSDQFEYAVAGDFGVTAYIESAAVEDFYIGAALLNLGYGTLFLKESEQTFMPPFDLNFGLSFSYFRQENVDLKFALNVFAPTFLNALVTPEFDFFFLDLFGIRLSTTIDCLALAGKTTYAENNRYGALFPSIGIYFRPKRTEDHVTGSASFGAKAVSQHLWTTGAGFTVTEGPQYPVLGTSKTQEEAPVSVQPKRIKTEFYIDAAAVRREKTTATFEQIPELTESGDFDAVVIPGAECELARLTLPFYVKQYSDLVSADLLIFAENGNGENPSVVLPIDLKQLKASDFKEGWNTMEIVWDSDSLSLPTGFYTAYVKGLRVPETYAETNRIRFYLDPELGFIKIFFDSVYETILQPNKDGKNRTIELRQIGSLSEKWEYRVSNDFFPDAYDGVIENDRPKTFIWDGKTKEKLMLPDGIYSYKIETITPRGNKLEAEYSNIVIESNYRETTIIFWNNTYSKRSPSIKIRASLVDSRIDEFKWIFYDVIDENLKVYYRSERQDPGDKVLIEYDGKDNAGTDLLPGFYRLRAVVADNQGNLKTVISDRFTVKE